MKSGVEVHWDKNAFRKGVREGMQKLQREARGKIHLFRCPDHPTQSFRTESEADGFRIIGCCDKGVKLAAEAAGLDVE